MAMKWWAAAALLAMLPGCGSGPRVVKPPQPSAQALQPDLPAPEGFVVEENTVNANPTGSWRVVHQTLEGRNRRIEGAAQFYRDAWPAQGWRLEESTGDPRNGPVVLVFANRTERARVEIADRTRDTVAVNVNVTKKE
jgi:hypothetical protein